MDPRSPSPAPPGAGGVLPLRVHAARSCRASPSTSTTCRNSSKLFPYVRQYQSWDEANRGNVAALLLEPLGGGAAKYYQALIRVCKGCTVIGLGRARRRRHRPDAASTSPNSSARSAICARSCRRSGPAQLLRHQPPEGWRTRELVRALGGQVWLTETGGIVQFGGGFPNKTARGLTRAAKVLKYMFAVAASQPRIQAPVHLRLDRRHDLDALRRRADERPRPAAPGLRGRLQSTARHQMQRQEAKN